MKIAIVKLSALGDIVHAMVVLECIKKHNPEIIIDWVVDKSCEELLDSHPDINKVYSVKLKTAKKKRSFLVLLKELRKIKNFGQYDVVIDMQGLIKSAIISRLISSPITLGFDKSSAREIVASFFYNKNFKYDYAENIVERNLKLIGFALGINVSKQEIQNKLPFLYSSQKYSTNKLSNIKKNILLIPGASQKAKCYPINSLAKLTTLIDANFLIIWGNSKEKIMAEELKEKGVNLSVCEKLSIGALKSLISQVDLVIGPDTGPTHMAWALNVSSITLFGPTPGYRNTYVTKINKIIESKSKVDPLKIDWNDFSIKDIDIMEVFKISQNLLNK